MLSPLDVFVVVDGHDDSCLAPPIENQELITSQELEDLQPEDQLDRKSGLITCQELEDLQG